MDIIYKTNLSSGEEIIFRYPTSEDVQVLLDYINTLSNEQTYIRFQGEKQTFEQEKEYLDNFLEKMRNGKAIKLMAFAGDKLIGVSDIDMHDRVEKHIGLFGITLAKEYRNQGIGKILMEKVLEEAQKNLKDLKIVTLSVFANNPIAHNMYKKMGFVEYGTLPKGLIHKGKYIDHIYMYKEI